jgi:hypothetical protein
MKTGEEPALSFVITLRANEVAAVDTRISEQPTPQPSREAAMALGVCDWLVAMRFLPPDACR